MINIVKKSVKVKITDAKEKMRNYFEILDPPLDEIEQENCLKILDFLEENYSEFYVEDQIVPTIIYIVNNQYPQYYLTYECRDTIGLTQVSPKITPLSRSINSIIKNVFPNIRSTFCTSTKMKSRVLRNRVDVIRPHIHEKFDEYLKKCPIPLHKSELQVCKSLLQYILTKKNRYNGLQRKFYVGLFPYIVSRVHCKLFHYQPLFYSRYNYRRVTKLVGYKEELNELLKMGNLFGEELDKTTFKIVRNELDYLFMEFVVEFQNFWKSPHIGKEGLYERKKTEYGHKEFRLDKTRLYKRENENDYRFR